MKKYWGILVAGALAAACASNNNPPAASASSVDEASSTPTTGPGFAPVTNDGTSAAAADANARSAAGNGSTSKPSTAPTASDHLAGAAAPTPLSNAAAMPAQDTPAGAPDNSRVNARDKSGKTLTPMDQGPSESDRKMTQQIRQAVVKDGSLSFTAKNVKIITINGKVTLRGPVKTDAEKSAIEAEATKVAGAGQVDNLLEVKN